MKVKFEATADLDTGTLTIICPEVFKLTHNGWGPEIESNYSAEYQERIGNLSGSALRARFMKIAQITVEELKRAKKYEEECKNEKS